MITSVTAAAQQVPAYCTSWTMTRTPAQLQTCWKLGWNQSTTTVANAGYFAGHNVAPWAIIAGIIIGLLWLVSRPRSGSPATSKG